MNKFFNTKTVGKLRTGEFVRDRSGNIGKVLLYREQDGKKGVWIEFRAYKRFVQLDKLNDLELIEIREDAKLKDLEGSNCDELWKVLELQSRKDHSYKLAKSSYKGFESIDVKVPANLKSDFEQLKSKIKCSCLFRFDKRHPYAKGEYDRKNGITKGVFQRGFDENDDFPVGIDKKQFSGFSQDEWCRFEAEKEEHDKLRIDVIPNLKNVFDTAYDISIEGDLNSENGYLYIIDVGAIIDDLDNAIYKPNEGYPFFSLNYIHPKYVLGAINMGFYSKKVRAIYLK